MEIDRCSGGWCKMYIFFDNYQCAVGGLLILLQESVFFRQVLLNQKRFVCSGSCPRCIMHQFKCPLSMSNPSLNDERIKAGRESAFIARCLLLEIYTFSHNKTFRIICSLSVIEPLFHESIPGTKTGCRQLHYCCIRIGIEGKRTKTKQIHI